MEQPIGISVAGSRSDIPLPRARTPSPIKRVLQTPAIPLPARNFDIAVGDLDVIYAEDEEVFRETAIRLLEKYGFRRSNIHEAENGYGALEHLARMQLEGNCTMPLVVLLDVRMPGMDGRECALQIQELVKKSLLRREPFVVCISSIHRQVIVDEGKGNFQVVLPKPFNTGFLDEVMDLLKRWWTMGHGRQLAAWKSFSPDELDIIAADDEPVCRLSSSAAFTMAGVSTDAVVEVDSEVELMEALEEAQEGSTLRPLLVLLGTHEWAAEVRTYVDREIRGQAGRREPFVVCTSVDSDRIHTSSAAEMYHAFLPRSYNQGDVKLCIEFCRLWWLTRGDGPGDMDQQSEEEEMEEMSDVEEEED